MTLTLGRGGQQNIDESGIPTSRNFSAGSVQTASEALQAQHVCNQIILFGSTQFQF